MHRSIVLVTLVSVLLIAYVHSQRPGVRVRFQRSLLESATRAAVDSLEDDIRTARIPTQSGKSGRLRYTISSIKVTGFTKPRSRVTVSPGAGITWVGTGGAISISLNWRVRYKVLFVNLKLSGGARISASRVNFRVSVKPRAASNGGVRVTATGCKVSIGKLDIRFSGRLRFLLNLFRKLVARILKPRIESLACKSVTKVINVNGNRRLATLNVRTRLPRNLQLDYGLTRNPIYTSRYVESWHKGVVTSTSRPGLPPFAPNNLQVSQVTDRMVTFWASEYVINSFSHAAHRNNLLRATRTFNNVNILGTRLNLRATLAATRAPYVRVTPRAITLFVQGTIGIASRQSNGQYRTLLTLAASLNTSVTVRISGNTVKGSVREIDHSFRVTGGGGASQVNALIQNVANQLIPRYVIPQLNSLGNRGMDLPNLRGVSFQRAYIRLINGGIRVSTDVRFMF